MTINYTVCIIYKFIEENCGLPGRYPEQHSSRLLRDRSLKSRKFIDVGQPQNEMYTCNHKYRAQTSRRFTDRFKEHINDNRNDKRKTQLYQMHTPGYSNLQDIIKTIILQNKSHLLDMYNNNNNNKGTRQHPKWQQISMSSRLLNLLWERGNTGSRHYSNKITHNSTCDLKRLAQQCMGISSSRSDTKYCAIIQQNQCATSV